MSTNVIKMRIKGVTYTLNGNADSILYDNSESELNASTVQEAIEEINSKVNYANVPTWSGYVGASSATTIANLNLNNLTHYTNASGVVNVTVSSSYVWFVINREVRIESSGIEVPVANMGTQDGYYYYKTYEKMLSSINAELIATDASQSDSGEVTPNAQMPTIVSYSSSTTYDEGATPNSLFVIANVSDGGTLTFQWYKNGSNFDNAQSGTAISGGYQSTITPTSDETATYYCRITNSLNGATPTTNQTSPVTITFNESSEPEETDLRGFSMGRWINDSQVEEDDESYCITPWYTATGEGTNVVCFLNGIANNSSRVPKYTWQTRNDGSVSSGQLCCGGRRTSCSSGVEVRVVMKLSRIDYCFVNIGGNILFKGSMIKTDFISMMGDPTVYFGKAFHRSNSVASLINKDGSGNLATEYAATWVTKPIELVSGHKYNFYVGWLASQSATDKYIITSEPLTSDGGSFVTGGYGKIETNIVVTGSDTNKYLYCNFSLLKLSTCYVRDVTDSNNPIYIIKGSDV